MIQMAVFQVKKYKTVKDENGNKIQIQKTKEEYNKETKNGSATWYFVDRYKINNITKQYKSALFVLKRDADADNALFKLDPIKYIQEHSKRAKNSLEIIKTSENNLGKSLNDYFPSFLEYKKSYIKGSSIYDDKINWKLHIAEDLGSLLPEEINLSIIQKWHDNANKKINPRTKILYAVKTKNTWHTTLSEFLQYLFSNGIIEANYARIVGCFKNPNVNKNEVKKIKYQTEEEFNFFMSVVDDPFWYKIFNFLFWHGPRKGEQRALRIEDINLEYNSVRFDETFARGESGGEILGSIKNGKTRDIYLARQSKPYIEELINFYMQMDGYNEKWFLFGGAHAVYKNRIEDKLKYYYDMLETKYPDKKINRLAHHEFGRHSHASYLLNEGLKKGLPIEEIYAIIANRLGDTIDVIKRTYAHLYETESNDKAKKILN